MEMFQIFATTVEVDFIFNYFFIHYLAEYVNNFTLKTNA